MRGKRWLLLVSLISLALIVGCSPMRSLGTTNTSGGMEAPMATAAPAAAQAPEEAKGGAAPAMDGSVANSSYSAALTEQMIIRTVNLTLVVEDVEASSQDIMATVTGFKGYVSGSNLWHEGTRVYANITLRVPAESLDALLSALRAKAVRIENENVSTQDVSQEYVDLESRLRNLEATEKELLKVLENVTERTYKAEDVLAVYRELTQIRAEIEQIKGRQQYLTQLTALATVTVSLQPVATPPSVVDEGNWNPMVAINGALRSLVNILRGMYDVVVVILLNVVPVLVILAIPVVVIILLVRSAKRRKANKSVSPQA